MRCIAGLPILIVLTLATAGLAQNTAPHPCDGINPAPDFNPVARWLDPAPFVLHLDGYALPACQALLYYTDRAAEHAAEHMESTYAFGDHRTDVAVRDVWIHPDEAKQVATWSLDTPFIIVHDGPRMHVLFVFATYGNRVTGEQGMLVTMHLY